MSKATQPTKPSSDRKMVAALDRSRDRKDSGEPVVVDPEPGLSDSKLAGVGDVLRQVMRNSKVSTKGRGRGGSKKLGMVTVNLCAYNSITSSANTALTAQIAIQPDVMQDFSSFSSIYDECRVESIHLKWRVETAGASPGFQAQVAAVVFDPIASTALTGIPQAGTYSQHTMLAFDVGATSVGAYACPRPVTHDGFVHFRAKVPSGTVKDNTLPQLIGHEWFDTVSATSMHVGWFKSYIPALGGTVASAIRYVMTLRVSFRSRA